MNDQDRVDMGTNARQVLDNPAFTGALDQLQTLGLEAFKRCDIRDAEGLKLARQFMAVTDDFEQILRRMVEGGRLAAIKLDQHRDENAMRKAARRFTR